MAAWDVVSQAAASEFEDRWAPVAEEVAQDPWTPIAQTPVPTARATDSVDTPRGVLTRIKEGASQGFGEHQTGPSDAAIEVHPWMGNRLLRSILGAGDTVLRSPGGAIGAVAGAGAGAAEAAGMSRSNADRLMRDLGVGGQAVLLEAGQVRRAGEPVKPKAAEAPKEINPAHSLTPETLADPLSPPPPAEPVKPSVPKEIAADTRKPEVPIEGAPVSEPKTPQGLADDLQVLRQSSVADRAEVGNVVKSLPEVARDPVLGEKLYHAAEDPAELAKLTPEERTLYDQHLQPLREEQAALAKRAKELGGADLVDDPNYIHRIAKGHAPAYDSLSGDAYDPVAGTRGLPRTTSAMQQRKYFAIENEAGVRKVVSANPDGLTVWNGKKGTNIAGNHELVPGGEVELNGKPWEVKQARTKEIEQHTNTEYHKNAFVNTADAVVRLREVVRNLEFVEKVKSSDWWMEHAIKAGGNREIPKGWVRPKMPQFSDWYVDPKYAHVLDDFYKPGYLDAESSLRKANQFATSSMFWNPIGHMQNVGVHWAVARGWDWLRPGPWRHFATDMTRALKETVTQGPEYQKWLREGGGLVYGGVKNADFYGDIGRQLGMDIEKNWGQYKPIFDKLGLKTPYEATAWWYSKMRNVLWATSDMFMMHRYLELERKGLPVKKALHEAEKHIPNYRIPTTIMGSREFSKIAQEPAFTVFSRYHYGMWRSFMNMATDLAKGTAKEKGEALGNVAALAAMGYLVYPVIDAIYQKITDDPKAKMLARGAMSVPRAAKEWWHNDISFSQFLGNQITAAPATKEVLQQFFGKDFFTGKPLEGAVPRVQHAAKALVSPYGTVDQTASGGRSTGRAALDTIVGGQNTSRKTEEGKKYGKRLRTKDALMHELKPKGLIEQGYYGAKKYVTKKMQEYGGPR